MSWRKWTASGRSTPRTSWAGPGRFSRASRSTNNVKPLWRVLGLTAACAPLAVATKAHAQAFAAVGSALVDYSKSELVPRQSCKVIGRYKSREIVTLESAEIAADASVPAHCRITGTLSPE